MSRWAIPTATPILLIHGYTDNSRSWSLVAPYLKTHRLLAIDLRGHGKSDAPECCYAYTDFANDAALFLDAMGIAKADVIGHSLGSMTGQLLAAQHPGKGRRAGAGLVDHGDRRRAGLMAVGQRHTADRADRSEQPVHEGLVCQSERRRRGFLTRERTESAAVPIHVWRGVLWGTVIDDLTLVAPLVKAPVLVLWGEKDGLFDLAHQEKLEKAYPDAVFQVFAGAGHNMFWEFPDKAASLINEFLDIEP